MSRELLVAFAIVSRAGRWRRGLNDKDLSYEIKFCGTVPIGEKAVVADTMEALRQGMEKETANELVGG